MPEFWSALGIDQGSILFVFYNQTVFQKSECSFFDQVAIDAESVLTLKKNVPLPPEGAFQMSTHF